MQKRGANVVRHGDFAAASMMANEIADARNVRYVSPDNDPFVTAGASSLAYDLFRTVTAESIEKRVGNDVLNVFVPYVGGGLLDAMIRGWNVSAATIEPMIAKANFVAATVANRDDTGWAAELGRRNIVQPDPTQPYFDSMAGDVEPGSSVYESVGSNYELTRPVSRTDIEEAAFLAWQEFGVAIEAPAAASLASALLHQMPYGANGAVITGQNVDPEAWSAVIHKVQKRFLEPDFVYGWVTRDQQIHQKDVDRGAGPREVLWVSTVTDRPPDPADDLRQLHGLGLTPLDPRNGRSELSQGL